MKTSAQWRTDRPGPDCLKPGPPPAIHSVAGGLPRQAPPDQMHTWHYGVGKEFCASAIVP